MKLIFKVYKKNEIILTGYYEKKNKAKKSFQKSLVKDTKFHVPPHKSHVTPQNNFFFQFFFYIFVLGI